jgi:hypothetical protein
MFYDLAGIYLLPWFNAYNHVNHAYVFRMNIYDVMMLLLIFSYVIIMIQLIFRIKLTWKLSKHLTAHESTVLTVQTCMGQKNRLIRLAYKSFFLSMNSIFSHNKLANITFSHVFQPSEQDDWHLLHASCAWLLPPTVLYIDTAWCCTVS